ncbi:BCCT family transporter [Alcaligenes endophyticus]|uniref:Choline BCCT transporter BetT n=1 Tax=Alcaligenes endophyticus TaxID=1929088 RepID=A0ABT8EF71_9BURK|nr:choline BCCT transporter BetT [Alcaligenes endophyticus]MCX5590390.1 choline BCCT transporter BetT [Alcaligenes endophyticus]MDN4119946.1 choline BCCT transporter BetT [Alcaligenes endophyticus]
MQTKTATSLHPPVFFSAAALILLIVILAGVAPEFTQTIFSATQGWILENVSWFYIVTVAIILLSVIFLAVSSYGNIKLGPDHSQPEYRDVTWFAMLFSTGMGIGLMFFGVAEPVMHFLDPPVGAGGTIYAAHEAMKITFFHWGLHAWAIYAIVALVLAFFSYRHGLPLKLRSALYPLIGDRIYGPIGNAVDTFAILGTVFGVATSLGFGVEQINSGLNYLFGLSENTETQITLIVIACGLATLSVASGLDRGIKILSEINLVLAVLLLVFVLALGPTVFLLQTFVQNTGAYLSDLVYKTFNLYAYEPNEWIGGWTLFYWGWWIAWSPFVGLFIARISRGRTIREFVRGVLLVPAGFTLFWMTVFGDTAIHYILVDGMRDFGAVVQANTSQALFVFLEELPLSSITSFIAICMVVVFFVTSADSGALVIDLLASKEDMPSPVWQRVFWSSLTGLVAIALLLTDGLTALQTATIASALPFSIILLASIWGLFRALKLDATKRTIRYQTVARSQPIVAGQPWQKRLRNLVVMPNQRQVNNFIHQTVEPAMNAVATELKKAGFDVVVEHGEDADHIPALSLHVEHHGEYQDFYYTVKPISHIRPSLHPNDADKDETRFYYRAEVFLTEGGQDYDIMGWSQDDVIGDLLDQYERHRHFLHLVHDTEAASTPNGT